MNAGARLATFGAGLVVAFGGALAASGAVVPDSYVAQWSEGNDVNTHDENGNAADQQPTAPTFSGLSIDADGFVLSPVEAPGTTGAAGDLSFQIQTASGEAVREFTEAHDTDLHLIVVRTDGAEYRHVHPELDVSTGTWSVPWTWDAAGTYRVYATFTPGAADAHDAASITVTRSVDVPGDLTLAAREVQRATEVDGFTVSLDGDLTAGEPSRLTVTVQRGGQPVTSLEPYLGAFGHLVALREGDLAYLHVHAEGDEPQAGDLAGPEVGFMAEAPTAGRYLMYLDFQVDGEVHTAELVIDAGHSDGKPSNDEGGH